MQREVLLYNALNVFNRGNKAILARLRKKWNDWEKAWEEISKRNGGLPDPEKEWRKLSQKGVKLVLENEEGYPPLLKEIADPPFGIYVRGKIARGTDLLAVVGTRKATPSGKEWARNFAFSLSKAGLGIVSGLALGIDAAAHEGCLSTEGFTIAVLGNGLDEFYPRTNERLAEKILSAGGAVISEYPLGTPSLSHHFLERNRIISGLSRGVLVIEAPERSGSLVTARMAMEQNREVFVLPGPANHPNFQGSHKLIRSGAELVTKSEDILESLNISNAPAPGTKEEEIVAKALKNLSQPVEVDKIAEITNLKPQTVSQALTFLMVKNLIKEENEGYTIKS